HEHELEAWARGLYDAVRARALEAKPGATWFVEKTPAHSLDVDLIARLVPGARVLHVVRDPRDVVASMLRASRGFGDDWAPDGVLAAAAMYRRYVTRARASGARLGDRFREHRYEDLVRDGPGEVLAWLGLPPSELRPD